MLLDFYSFDFDATKSPLVTNNWDQIVFDEVDLLHATYTVGRANRFSVLKHGLYSYYEMIYRTAMIRANLMENSDGFLEKSPAYKNLDPSEKGAVSYFIGMTILKLLAEIKLEVPYMMHLEVYQDIIKRRVGKISYKKGRSRPDFIAMNSDLKWFVFESKGRTNNIPEGLLEDAKEQTTMIRSIGGKRPFVKAACVSYFDKKILHANWVDPSENHKYVNIDLEEVNPIKFIRDYYKPYFELTRSPIRTNEKDYIIFDLGSIGVSFKFPEILYEKLQEPDLTEEKLSDLLKETEKMKYEKTELKKKGKDGIVLELDETWKGRFKKKSINENE